MAEPWGPEQQGVDPTRLAEDDLLRELAQVHSSRDATFRHGSADALAMHDRRTAELEGEYLRRHPMREVDPARLRAGSRRRAGQQVGDDPAGGPGTIGGLPGPGIVAGPPGPAGDPGTVTGYDVGPLR